MFANDVEKLPRCSECDSVIKAKHAFYINDEWLCVECMKDYLKEVF